MPPDPPSLPSFYKAQVSPPKLKILYETLVDKLRVAELEVADMEIPHFDF